MGKGKSPVKLETFMCDDDLDQLENMYNLYATQNSSSSARDRQDMARMGLKSELKRKFDIWSSIGYSSIVSSSWETALIVIMYGLINGGTGGVFWMYIISSVGMFAVTLSMAEMAAMYPSAGAQHHWVSELAPASMQRWLSFIVGSLGLMGWQASLALAGYFAADQFQILISLSHPDYTISGWCGTVMTIIIIAFAILFNTFLLRKVPALEGLLFLLHITAFAFFVVVIWVMGARTPSDHVITDFYAYSDWEYQGMAIACLVGMAPQVAVLVGTDAACHLSEEVKNASWAVPRAMITTSVLNTLSGLLIILTLIYNLDDDIMKILLPDHVLSYVTIIYNTTQSLKITYFCAAVMALLMCACCINRATAASRQTYAFARNNGLPYSNWLSYVRPGSDVPIYSLLATWLFSALMSLLMLGSSSMFQTFTSFALTGLISSYLFAINFLLWRKIKSHPLPNNNNTFRLGRVFGIIINVVAIVFLTVAALFCYFPILDSVNRADMNWNVVIMAGCIIFSAIYYFFHGRHCYTAPVDRARR